MIMGYVLCFSPDSADEQEDPYSPSSQGEDDEKVIYLLCEFP